LISKILEYITKFLSIIVLPVVVEEEPLLMEEAVLVGHLLMEEVVAAGHLWMGLVEEEHLYLARLCALFPLKPC